MQVHSHDSTVSGLVDSKNEKRKHKELNKVDMTSRHHFPQPTVEVRETTPSMKSCDMFAHNYYFTI